MKLNERLFELRRKAGLSQEELADKIGVSRQAVGKWENGASVPELDKLLSLSDFYQLSIGQLLGVEAPAQTAAEAPAVEPGPAVDTGELEALLRGLGEGQKAAEHRAKRQRGYLWGALGIAAAAIVAVAVIFGSRMADLKGQIGGLNQLVVFTQNSLSDSIDGMRGTIAGLLEEQNRLFSDWSCETLDYDAPSGLLTVRAAVTPKSLGRDMTARLSLVSDETDEAVEAEAELENGVFSAVIQAPEGSYTLWAVLIEDGTETRGQAGSVTVTPGQLAEVYGVQWFRGPAQSAQEGDGFTWEPRGLLVIDPRTDRPLASAEITVRVGGQIVNTIPLDLAGPANWYAGYTLPEDILSVSTSLTRPESLTPTRDRLFALEVDLGPFHCAYRHWVEITLTAVDELGVAYRFSLLDMHLTSEKEPVPPDLHGELEAE